MEKILVVISEGKHPPKLIRGLNFALKSTRLGIISEVSVLFWGESEEAVVEDDPHISTLLESLKKAGVKLWARQSVAKEKGIAEKLETRGIKVESATKVVNEAVRDGFATAWF